MYSRIFDVSSWTVALTLTSPRPPSFRLVYSIRVLDLGWNPLPSGKSIPSVLIIFPLFETIQPHCPIWMTSLCHRCRSWWCGSVSLFLTHSWHTAWCHPCRAGGWLLPHYGIGTRSQYSWWSDWGGSGLCRTAVVIAHLLGICRTWCGLGQSALNWPLGLSSTFPSSSGWRPLGSCWSYTVPDIPVSMCAALSHRLSCSQSRQCTGWSVSSYSLGRLFHLFFINVSVFQNFVLFRFSLFSAFLSSSFLDQWWQLSLLPKLKITVICEIHPY